MKNKNIKKLLMKMIDRVTQIDYNGGMYGRGIICGEKQITPDMWPFKAHFKNDPVFPAIIMTDGVTQLGVFLFAHFPEFQREHPRLSRKFADTIECTYSACSWMPDDRFQDAILDAVDEFLGTAPKVDIY